MDMHKTEKVDKEFLEMIKEEIELEKYNIKEEFPQALSLAEKQKAEKDNKLLRLKGKIETVSVLILLFFSFVVTFAEMEPLSIIRFYLFGFSLFTVGMLAAVRIEQITGYYVCPKCNHKYTPSFISVLFAPRMVKRRYMICPRCGEWSWNEKFLNLQQKREQMFLKNF